MRREDQRERPSLRHLVQLRQRIFRRSCGQLGLVALAKLREFFGIVAVPFAQFIARRDLLEPEIDMRAFLREAARPEALHQHARPVALLRLIIHPLESNRRFLRH